MENGDITHFSAVDVEKTGKKQVRNTVNRYFVHVLGKKKLSGSIKPKQGATLKKGTLIDIEKLCFDRKRDNAPKATETSQKKRCGIIDDFGKGH